MSDNRPRTNGRLVTTQPEICATRNRFKVKTITALRVLDSVRAKETQSEN